MEHVAAGLLQLQHKHQIGRQPAGESSRGSLPGLGPAPGGAGAPVQGRPPVWGRIPVGWTGDPGNLQRLDPIATEQDWHPGGGGDRPGHRSPAAMAAHAGGRIAPGPRRAPDKLGQAGLDQSRAARANQNTSSSGSWRRQAGTITAAVSEREVAAGSNFHSLTIDGLTKQHLLLGAGHRKQQCRRQSAVRGNAGPPAGPGPTGLLAQTVNGRTLTLRFSKRLDRNSVPKTTDFVVMMPTEDCWRSIPWQSTAMRSPSP